MHHYSFGVVFISNIINHNSEKRSVDLHSVVSFLRVGSRGSANGGHTGSFFKRTSVSCERANFSRNEIVFMLSNALLERIL